MQIIIYTTAACPYCKMLKTYLGGRNIAFTEKLVDKDDAVRKEMADKSKGYLGVPFTVIEKDGNEQTVIGFNKAKLDAILGL